MKIAELKQMFADRGLAPSMHRGQNFLVDPSLLATIPRDAGVQAGDRVLEVGPGTGALTEVLLEAGARVLAVELDHGLAAYCAERFGEHEGFELVVGDALGKGERFHSRVEAWWQEGPPPRIVSNLPYGISGPFLGRLPGRPLLGACLLLQQEVAEKAAGRPPGPLPIRLAAAFAVRLGRRVPAEVFWPRPQVDSAFLHLDPGSGSWNLEQDQRLAGILRVAFSQRRKLLLPRLRKVDAAAAEALLQAGVSQQARAEDVAPATWLQASATKRPGGA